MDIKKPDTKETKGRMLLVMISILVLVAGGILWFQFGIKTGNTGLIASENMEKHNDESGHKEGADDDHVDHGEEGAHGGEAEHEEHGDHGDETEGIKLSKAEMDEFGIKLAPADAGKLYRYVSLPGEVRPNGDRLAHLVPRVSGVVRKVLKGFGNHVKKGEVMAILDSRELSDTKAAFLAASERVSLAKSNFEREEALFQKKISSEQEYLEAKQVLAEARIDRRSAEQKLHALGFSNRYLDELPNHPEESFTQYQIIAPFSGTIIEKHITLGEFLKDEADAFIIADLSSVWVDLSVYQKDLPWVAKGQSVVVEATQGNLKTTAALAYLGPVIGEATRTALARIVLPNKDGEWRPGLFVNAKIAVDAFEVKLAVPRSALQKFAEGTVVFVLSDGELKPRPVTLGRHDENQAEITGGIHWGEEVVVEGAFTLRAQLEKGNLGDGHNH